MAAKLLQFRIVPTVDGKAKTEAKKLTDELRHQNKELEKQKKAWAHQKQEALGFLKTTDDGFVKLGRSLRRFRDETKTAFSLGPLAGIRHFQSGIEGTIKKVFNLKNALMGTAVGAAAFFGGRHILRAGQDNINTEFRLNQFQDRDRIRALVSGRSGIAARAGLDDSGAMSAMFPIFQAVEEIQGGTAFRGKTLNQSQADKLRRTNLEFGAKLFERIATIAPQVDPNQLGELLANAGTGPEGVLGLVSALGLNRVFARRVLAANEKGNLAQLLSADRAAKFGVKAGQQAGQGTIVDILLQQAGFTDENAQQRRSTLAFQMKSIGASLEDALGNVGQAALEKVSGSLAKGKTLAEQFSEVLTSPKGQETIKKLGEGLGSVVEGLLKLATKLPEVLGFIDRNKGTLLAIGGAYGALRLGAGISGIAQGFNPGKAVDGIFGKTFPGGAAPVYVTNQGFSGVGQMPGAMNKMAGVMSTLGSAVAALGAGFAIGTAIDQKFGTSDFISEGAHTLLNGRKEVEGVMAHRSRLAGINAAREARIKAFMEQGGLTKGQAIFAADHPGQAVQTAQGPQIIQLTVDGKVLTQIVNDHTKKQLRNAHPER